MSIERVFTFELLDNGESKERVLEIMENLKKLDVDIDFKKVDVALTQYEAKGKAKNQRKIRNSRKNYVKEKLKERIEEIKNTKGDLSKVCGIKKKNNYSCEKCDKDKQIYYYLKMKIVSENDFLIPDKKFLLRYCKNCGHINTSWL